MHDRWYIYSHRIGAVEAKQCIGMAAISLVCTIYLYTAYQFLKVSHRASHVCGNCRLSIWASRFTSRMLKVDRGISLFWKHFKNPPTAILAMQLKVLEESLPVLQSPVFDLSKICVTMRLPAVLLSFCSLLESTGNFFQRLTFCPSRSRQFQDKRKSWVMFGWHIWCPKHYMGNTMWRSLPLLRILQPRQAKCFSKVFFFLYYQIFYDKEFRLKLAMSC